MVYEANSMLLYDRKARSTRENRLYMFDFSIKQSNRNKLDQIQTTFRVNPGIVRIEGLLQSNQSKYFLNMSEAAPRHPARFPSKAPTTSV